MRRCDGEATGATQAWRGDVAAVAKRALKAGERLDGEGGYTVYGKLMPAAASSEIGALPIGLAHNVTLLADVAAGAVVTRDAVKPHISAAWRARDEMEAASGKSPAVAPGRAAAQR